MELAKEGVAACVAAVFSDPAFADLFQRLYCRCVVWGRNCVRACAGSAAPGAPPCAVGSAHLQAPPSPPPEARSGAAAV